MPNHNIRTAGFKRQKDQHNSPPENTLEAKRVNLFSMKPAAPTVLQMLQNQRGKHSNGVQAANHGGAMAATGNAGVLPPLVLNLQGSNARCTTNGPAVLNAGPIESQDQMTTWVRNALQEDNIKVLLKEIFEGPRQQINQNTYRITSLEEQVANLTHELDDLKQYSRRDSIRITNPAWKETTGENTDQMVLDFIANDLGIRNFSSRLISRSHRAGRPKEDGSPRPVLVKFVGYRAREEVFKARKRLPRGIYINEDLTHANNQLYALARQMKKDNDLEDTWVYDGRVFIKPLGSQRGTLVRTMEELYNHSIAGNQNSPPGRAMRSQAQSHDSSLNVITTSSQPLPQMMSTVPTTRPITTLSFDTCPFGGASAPSPWSINGGGTSVTWSKFGTGAFNANLGVISSSGPAIPNLPSSIPTGNHALKLPTSSITLSGFSTTLGGMGPDTSGAMSNSQPSNLFKQSTDTASKHDENPAQMQPPTIPTETLDPTKDALKSPGQMEITQDIKNSAPNNTNQQQKLTEDVKTT